MGIAILVAALLMPVAAAAQPIAPGEPWLVAVDEQTQVSVQPQRQLSLPFDQSNPQRPRALMPLYGSFAALQGLDIYTTRRAIESGGQEGNPMMRAAVKRDSTMIAAKAAGSVFAIWATERLWKKKRPKLAIASGVLLNVVSGLVVMNNYRITP